MTRIKGGLTPQEFCDRYLPESWGERDLQLLMKARGQKLGRQPGQRTGESGQVSTQGFENGGTGVFLSQNREYPSFE